MDDRSSRRSRNAFTLVELLVAMGIIAVVIGILVPSLAAARRSAKRIQCAAQLHAVGQAIAMYAQENRSFAPFAAYPNVSANLVQTPDFTLTPPVSYRLYSGLLVRSYLGDSVATIFCPVRDEEGWLQQQGLFANTTIATQAWTNYIHRGTTMKLWPKLTRRRQAVMHDWYWTRGNPPLPGDDVNHPLGINCLYTDGSALWHVLPAVWRHNTQESWDQIDVGEFRPM
jgi:prepilin-type N-terminal cleavage/methylation domain-containing protein